MPLNWLQSMQYADIPGSVGKGIVNKHNQLQNDILEEKLGISNALKQSMDSGALNGVQDNSLLQRLSVIDPQAATSYMKVKDSLNPTPYSGEGFQNQLAGAQYRAYIKAGYPADEAARLAGSDVMQMKQDVYTDEYGNTHQVKSNALPNVNPRAKELISEVLTAPEAERPKVYKDNLKKAKDEGMQVSDMPPEYTPELNAKLLDLFPGDIPPAGSPADPVRLFNAGGEVMGGSSSGVNNSPKVKIKAAEERVVQSEQRRGEIIKATYEARDRAIATSNIADTIKTNLDGLVESGNTTGPAAPMVTFLNDLGAQMGIAPDMNLGVSSSLTQIEGYSNQLAVPMTKALGVNPTDKDFEIVKSTVARAGTSIPANYSFLYVLKQTNDRQKRLSDVVEESNANGDSESLMKKKISAFNESSHIISPRPFPSDKRSLKKGETYATERGIEIFDGSKLIQVY